MAPKNAGGKGVANKTAAGLRIRNIGLRRVAVSSLEDAPWNFRTHPELQRGALDGTIEELGFFGYPDVYETTEGVLRICDGHLRKDLLISKYGAETEIEVNVTDFDESEAKRATLTKDPIAALAEANNEKLEELLQECEFSSGEISKMLSDLSAEANCEGESSSRTFNRDAEYPLTPVPGERYEYVMIFCENEPDWAMLQTLLGVDRRQSYKSKSVATGRVVRFTEFKKRWDNKNGS